MKDNYLGEDFSWSKVMWMGIGMFFLMFIVGTVLQVLIGAQNINLGVAQSGRALALGARGFGGSNPFTQTR